ncbi:hypothetical protein NMG60_11034209 [Bertholletia excelsa]
MNPLTLVKRIQNINSKEAALGISEEASWHAKYKDSAYVFVGGIPFDLTEGDLLAVFAQYGEIVDVNLVRDKGTGKSKGFAFIAYEDQRSTNLAVDNLNGAQILGRIIRVDHVTNYKKREEEDEETQQQKREARGVCRAFQRGECNRGAACKFSHDEQRAANTGWGANEDKSSRWGHDNFEEARNEKRTAMSNIISESKGHRSSDRDAKSSRTKGREDAKEWRSEQRESKSERDSRDRERQTEWKEREQQDKLRESKSEREHRDRERQSEWKEREKRHEEDLDKRGAEKRSRRHDAEPNSRDHDRRDEKRSRRHESEFYEREDRDTRGRDRRTDPYKR